VIFSASISRLYAQICTNPIVSSWLKGYKDEPFQSFREKASKKLAKRALFWQVLIGKSSTKIR